MIIFLKILTLLFLQIIPGFLILQFIGYFRNKPILFNLAVAYGLGGYLITIQLFLILFIFKLRFNFFVFLLVVVSEIFLLLYFIFKREYKIKFSLRNLNFLMTRLGRMVADSNMFKFSRPKRTALAPLGSNLYFQQPKLEIKKIVLILVILLQISFLFFHVLSRPVMTYDSLAAWSYKAKVLYYQDEVSFDENNFNYLGGGGHINYPWHIPLQQFWWQKFLGKYSDLYVNLIYVLYFISILIVLYYALVRFIGSFGSLLLVFFLSSMPLFFYHGFNAYADLPLSYFALLAFVLLLASLKNSDNKLLILAGVFFGIAFFVKIEGIIYIMAAILSLLLFSSQIKKQISHKKFGKSSLKNFNFLMSRLGRMVLDGNVFKSSRPKRTTLAPFGPNLLIGMIIPFLPWAFFLIKYNLGISNIESAPGFHPEIFKNLFFSLFASNNWNIWWYIAIVVFLLNIKRVHKEKELLFSWGFLLLSFGGFLVLYLFTGEYQFALDHSALSRNILTLAPLSVLAAGMTFKKLKL